MALLNKGAYSFSLQDLTNKELQPLVPYCCESLYLMITT